VTDADYQRIMNGFQDVMQGQEWHRLGEFVHEDAIFEYPQSGERFRGIANIRAQFENHPDLDPDGAQLQEVIGGVTYALTPMYTVVAVEGSGDRATAIVRVRYADGSHWWAVNLFEVRDGKIGRSRTFFAPVFEPPEWRRPFHDTTG
jgi:hypothetical protein